MFRTILAFAGMLLGSMALPVANYDGKRNLTSFHSLHQIDGPIIKLQWKAKNDILLASPPNFRTLIAFAPDSETLIAGTGDKIRFFNIATGKKTGDFEFKRNASITSMALSPTGKILAITDLSDQSNGIGLWEIEQGKEVRRLAGHAFTPWDSGVVFSPDGRSLISNGPESPNGIAVRLWDLETGGPKAAFAQPLLGIVAAAISPDGRTLAVDGHNGKITLIELQSGRPRLTFVDDKHSAPGPIMAIAFSPDGKLVAAVNNDCVCIHDLQTGRLRHRLTKPEWKAVGHITTNLCFTQNGEAIGTGSLEGQGITFWNVITGKEVAALQAMRGETMNISVSADGKWLAASGATGEAPRIKLWELLAITRR